jgi:hypothetical protein
MKPLKEIKVTVKLVPVACDIIAEYGDYLMLRDDGQGAFVVIGKYHAVPIEAPTKAPPVPAKPLVKVQRSETIAIECETIVRVMSQNTDRSYTPTEIGEILRVQLERHEPILPHIYSNRIQALLKSGRIHQVEHGLYQYGPPSPAKQSEAAD